MAHSKKSPNSTTSGKKTIPLTPSLFSPQILSPSIFLQHGRSGGTGRGKVAAQESTSFARLHSAGQNQFRTSPFPLAHNKNKIATKAASSHAYASVRTRPRNMHMDPPSLPVPKEPKEGLQRKAYLISLIT